MSDPIAPPAAQWPSQAPELVSLAVSDGDLGAAVAQYEPGAALAPWADDQVSSDPVRETMTRIMRLRLPLEVRLLAVLSADGLTMLVCERRIEGAGPDGTAVRLRGVGSTVVRAQPDGAWRIAVDAWRLRDTPDTSPVTPSASPSVGPRDLSQTERAASSVRPPVTGKPEGETWASETARSGESAWRRRRRACSRWRRPPR